MGGKKICRFFVKQHKKRKTVLFLPAEKKGLKWLQLTLLLFRPPTFQQVYFFCMRNRMQAEATAEPAMHAEREKRT